MRRGPLDKPVRLPAELPARYLPPGRVVDAYCLYQAACTQRREQVASRETFRLCWQAWANTLKFRKKSCHATCSECYKLKARMRKANRMQEQVEAQIAYLHHLQHQLQDRETYWGIRARARLQADIVSIIADGMDRSKFRLPRFPGGRTPKDCEKYHRPVMELTAHLNHGVGLYLYLCDEDIPIGSSWSAHCFLHTLESTRLHYARKGQRMPEHCHLQSDNTAREIKNSILMKVMSCLTQQRFF